MVRWPISVSTTNGKPLRFLVSATLHKSYPRHRIVASITRLGCTSSGTSLPALFTDLPLLESVPILQNFGQHYHVFNRWTNPRGKSSFVEFILVIKNLGGLS